MIDHRNNPVAWAMLVYQLDDARDHLQTLLDQMSAEHSIDEIDFRTQISHIYSHLNRAWNGRNDSEETKDADRWQSHGQFPKELEPL